MKSFKFENIWLLSHVERKALRVTFHPRKNLIVGRNHTGKTSLIRSLFETLGAIPEGKLELWNEGTISLVEFSIDGRVYFAIHQYGKRALFDSNKALIGVASRNSEWARLFSGISGFNLVFSDKESDSQPADTSCFFVPFYINQDGSWQAGWDTFKGMRRFSSPWTAILEYFTGTCPPAYYHAKAERDKASKELEEQKREAKILERTRERFSKALPQNRVKLSPENFEKEIALLTKQVSELNLKQEEIRTAVSREQDLLSSIEQQIRLADEALRSYGRDSQYLRDESHAPLVCPTCHAEHPKSFMDILSFAEDARVLHDISARLRDDAAEVKRRLDSSRATLGKLSSAYDQVCNTLDTRRGELKFQDVVDSAGAESAFAAFESERASLQAEIDKLAGSVDFLSEKMKGLRNRKRSAEILSEFRNSYASARFSLGLQAADTSKMKLTSRPDLSGSGGPRSILAYYSALWRACAANGDYRIPLVIDSPNQQGQDDINLPKVRKFIANDLPQDAQIIVGLEAEKEDMDFDYRLTLERPRQLLTGEDFDPVSAVVEPLLGAMQKGLQADDAQPEASEE